MKAATPPSIDRYFSKLWEANQGFIIVFLLLIAIIVIIKTGGNISDGLSNLWRKWFGATGAPERPKPDNNNIPVGWSPDAIVAELWAALDGWGIDGQTKCEAARKLYELNDDQFKAAVNKFESLHYTEEYPTLKAKMQGEWSTCSVFSTDWFDKVYQKMARLGY